jgi:hypothetical protein
MLSAIIPSFLFVRSQMATYVLTTLTTLNCTVYSFFASNILLRRLHNLLANVL